MGYEELIFGLVEHRGEKPAGLAAPGSEVTAAAGSEITAAAGSEVIKNGAGNVQTGSILSPQRANQILDGQYCGFV